MSDEQSKQSKGGEERAKKLSKDRKREIAQQAAAAKHGWPQATHEGPLTVGGVTLDTAVLDDGRAVISETRFMEQMGIYRSGALSTRRERPDEAGTPRAQPLHLAFKNLQPFVVKHFGETGLEPFKYRTKTGGVAHGILAESLPKVCEVWLDARKAGGLGPRQEQIADMCDILIRGFAHIGIVALVHEATGWQYERQRDALQELLQELLSDKLRRWVKTFPDAYFRELCRLKGVTYRPDMKLPQYFGHFTNNIVYKRLHPHILEKLQELNPRVNGRRLNKNFQRLSEDVGQPQLLMHLGLTVGLMKTSKTYPEFEKKLDEVAPIYDDENFPPLLRGDSVETLPPTGGGDSDLESGS